MPPAPPLLGLILAGGAGRRMGGEKPFALLEGRPLVAHAIARLAPQTGRLGVNVGAAGTPLAVRLAGLGLPCLTDAPELAGLGPLSGVRTGLAALKPGEWLLTLPCDLPRAPPDLAARLAARQAATGAPVVHVAGLRDHPLCAIWSPALLAPLTAALREARAEGGLRVMRFLATAGAARLAVGPAEEEAAFANLNDPAALARVQRLTGGEDDSG